MEHVCFSFLRLSVWKTLEIFRCVLALRLVCLSAVVSWLGCNLWGMGWRHLIAVRALELCRSLFNSWPTSPATVVRGMRCFLVRLIARVT